MSDDAEALPSIALVVALQVLADACAEGLAPAPDSSFVANGDGLAWLHPPSDTIH